MIILKKKSNTMVKFRVDLPPKAVEIYHQACKLSEVDLIFVNRNQKTHLMSSISSAFRIKTNLPIPSYIKTSQTVSD